MATTGGVDRFAVAKPHKKLANSCARGTGVVGRGVVVDIEVVGDIEVAGDVEVARDVEVLE